MSRACQEHDREDGGPRVPGHRCELGNRQGDSVGAGPPGRDRRHGVSECDARRGRAAGHRSRLRELESLPGDRRYGERRVDAILRGRIQEAVAAARCPHQQRRRLHAAPRGHAGRPREDVRGQLPLRVPVDAPPPRPPDQIHAVAHHQRLLERPLGWHDPFRRPPRGAAIRRLRRVRSIEARPSPLHPGTSAASRRDRSHRERLPSRRDPDESRDGRHLRGGAVREDVLQEPRERSRDADLPRGLARGREGHGPILRKQTRSRTVPGGPRPERRAPIVRRQQGARTPFRMRRGFAPEPLWPSPSVRREPMQGTRVLVTGGAGFIGSHLVEHLGAHNEVAVLDDLSAGSLRNLQTVPRDVHVNKDSILNPQAPSASLKGLETVVVRIFNAYGPRQDLTSPYASVIAKFCASVAANDGIEIYGDGGQTRDFLYVGDLTAALELAGERPVAGAIINVGSGFANSVNEVARLLSEIAGVPIRTKHGEPRPGDVRDSRADITKAAAKLGFAPRTSLREGLGQTLAWYRSQRR